LTPGEICALHDDAIEEHERIARLCLGWTDFDASGGAAMAVSNLNFAQCRYPSGDPRNGSFKFCEEMRDGSSPYCARHAKLCWTSRPPVAPGPAKKSRILTRL